MDDLELQPRYSTKEISGKCIKCLAEQESRECLLELLRCGGENKEVSKIYQALVSFLTSPELYKLRDETERHLSEGRNVKVILHLSGDKPRYEIKVV